LQSTPFVEYLLEVQDEQVVAAEPENRPGAQLATL
jgi:hypothetical protein